MSRRSHPDDGQLLRYTDGELPARASAKIRTHLEACWQCRADLDELEKTIGECVRYRKYVLQTKLPPPPQPWDDIHRHFAGIDGSVKSGSLSRLAAGMLHFVRLHARQLAAAAVGVALVFALIDRFRQTPSVQAAELLRNAIAAASAHPNPGRRLEIRTKTRRIYRSVGATHATAFSADQDVLDSFAALFGAAHYDWDNPLSARSYQSWRDHLAQKTDAVLKDRDSYQLRTTTDSGSIMEATLRIRVSDLHPTEGRFEFRDRQWLEISEVPETSPAPAGAAADTHAVEHENGTHITEEPPQATIGDELRVMAALHQIGADLGDPVEVSRAGGTIVVAGAGISPQRQEQIHGALVSNPRVVFRFSNSLPPPARSGNTSAATEIRPHKRHEPSGSGDLSELASRVLEASEPMMARAYALRRLAETFSVEREPELSPGDRDLLAHLRQEHTAALKKEILELNRLLDPMLPSGARNDSAVRSFSGAWQPATEAVFQSARRLDRLLAMMFGGAPAESEPPQILSDLAVSLAQLRGQVDAYDRLTGKDPDRSNR